MFGGNSLVINRTRISLAPCRLSQIFLKAARTKANEIIDQAHQRANQLIDAAKADAIADGNRQKALAEAEIVSAANRAKEDLRKQVSVLAVSGAEKLLKREIDANAHKALIDDLAAQL